MRPFGLALLAALAVAPAAWAAPTQLLIVNQREHALVKVDVDSRKEVARLDVGVNGHEIAVRDGLAYVPIYSDVSLGEVGKHDGSTIDVVDLKSWKVIRSIDLGQAVRPHSAQFGKDGLLYVTAEVLQAVMIVDVETDKVVGQIPTGRNQSHMLLLSPDGKRGYTANVDNGSVSVLDLEHRKLVTVIQVADHIQRLSLSKDGTKLFTHDIDHPKLAVIDTRTNEIAEWIPLPGAPYASALTPDGKLLLIRSPTGDLEGSGKGDGGRLYVLDLASKQVIHRIPMAGSPGTVLMAPDGRHAYAPGSRAGKVDVFELTNFTAEAPVVMTLGVDGVAFMP
jgi:DNA-binding beta-propeller fold protein YncE